MTLDLEHEHSGTGCDRNVDDFDFVDASVSPSSRLFLISLLTDISHVRLAWYIWTWFSSKSFTSSFLQHQKMASSLHDIPSTGNNAQKMNIRMGGK